MERCRLIYIYILCIYSHIRIHYTHAQTFHTLKMCHVLQILYITWAGHCLLTMRFRFGFYMNPRQVFEYSWKLLYMFCCRLIMAKGGVNEYGLTLIPAAYGDMYTMLIIEWMSSRGLPDFFFPFNERYIFPSLQFWLWLDIFLYTILYFLFSISD